MQMHCFWRPKKRPNCWNWGEEGEMPERKHFFTNVFPYLCFPDCKTIENWRLVNNLTQEVITDATIECKAESGGEWSISSTFLVWESLVSTSRCILRWNWVQEHQGVPGCLRKAGLCNLHGRGRNKLWRHLNCILRSVLIFPICWNLIDKGAKTAKYLVFCFCRSSTLGSFFAAFCCHIMLAFPLRRM